MPAESALPARPDLRLIETLGWRAREGFARLDRHMARLARSAAALGFICDPAAARAAVTRAVDGLDAEQARVRLTLGPTGDIEAAATPFAPLAEGTVWTAIIATHRLDSRDTLLAHKTTRRAFYDDARADAARRLRADEALFLNERGEVCEGSITNVFVERDGVLLTPPLASGLLPGCLRDELIEAGRARESVLRPADLVTASRWYLGNSLRGLIPARLDTTARTGAPST